MQVPPPPAPASPAGAPAVIVAVPPLGAGAARVIAEGSKPALPAIKPYTLPGVAQERAGTWVQQPIAAPAPRSPPPHHSVLSLTTPAQATGNSPSKAGVSVSQPQSKGPAQSRDNDPTAEPPSTPTLLEDLCSGESERAEEDNRETAVTTILKSMAATATLVYGTRREAHTCLMAERKWIEMAYEANSSLQLSDDNLHEIKVNALFAAFKFDKAYGRGETCPDPFEQYKASISEAIRTFDRTFQACNDRVEDYEARSRSRNRDDSNASQSASAAVPREPNARARPDDQVVPTQHSQEAPADSQLGSRTDWQVIDGDPELVCAHNENDAIHGVTSTEFFTREDVPPDPDFVQQHAHDYTTNDYRARHRQLQVVHPTTLDGNGEPLYFTVQQCDHMCASVPPALQQLVDDHHRIGPMPRETQSAAREEFVSIEHSARFIRDPIFSLLATLNFKDFSSALQYMQARYHSFDNLAQLR